MQDFLKKSWAKVTALIGAVTALVVFFNLVVKNTTISLIAVLALTIGCLLLTCGYVYFSTSETDYKLEGVEPRKIYRFSKASRRAALLGFLIIPLLVLAPGIKWHVDQASYLEKTVILVADFDGIDESKYRFTDQILRTLRSQARQYPDIVIKPLNQSITERGGSEEARRIGKKKRADAVIWGYYSVTNSRAQVVSKFDVLEPAANSPLGSGEILVDTATSRVDDFSLQADNADSMSRWSLFSIGLVKLEQKEFQISLRLLNQAIDLLRNPNSDDARDLYFYRGTANFFLDNYSDAVSDLLNSISIDPDFWKARKRLGGFFLYEGDFRKALEQYQKALESSPQNPELYSLIGATYAQGFNNNPKALEYFSKSIELNNKHSRTFFNRAIVYGNQGKIKEAVDDLTRSIELERGNPQAAYLQRGILLSESDPQQSIDDLIKASKLPVKELQYSALLSLGQYYLLEFGDTRKAIRYLNKSVELNSEMSPAHALLALAYHDLGNEKKAASYIRKAFSKEESVLLSVVDSGSVMDETFTQFYMPNVNGLIAEWVKSRFQTSDAERFCKTILEISPDDYNSYLSCGKYAIIQARDDLAIIELSNGVAIANEEESEKLISERAKAYQRQGKSNNDPALLKKSVRDATKLISKASATTADLKLAYLIRGEAYTSLGDLPKALHDYEKALTLSENNSPALYGAIGEIYKNQGNLAQAISNFEKAAANVDFRTDMLAELVFLSAKEGKCVDTSTYMMSLREWEEIVGELELTKGTMSRLRNLDIVLDNLKDSGLCKS